MTVPTRNYSRLLLTVLLAILLAGTAALAGTAPAEANTFGPQSAASGIPQLVTTCPPSGAEGTVKTVVVKRPATSGSRSVSVNVTLQDSSNSSRELYFKLFLLSGDHSQDEGGTVIFEGERTFTVPFTIPSGVPSDGFRVVVQLFSADQTDDCGSQEYEVLPGLPETFYRYWYADVNQSFPVLVPADYFSPVEIAKGITGRAFDGSKHWDNRVELYQSIALELAQKEPLQKNEYFEFTLGGTSSEASATAADVFESCREAVEVVQSTIADIDPDIFCIHLEHLGSDTFFSELPVGGVEFSTVFSEAVMQTVEVQEARETLRQIRDLPSLDSAWRAGVDGASAHLTSEEFLDQWSGALKRELSEIVIAINYLKSGGDLALSQAKEFILKKGLVLLARTASIPIAYVDVALYSYAVVNEIYKFVGEGTENFWDDVSMASASAQVYGSLQTVANDGDGSIDDQTLRETLEYTKFTYYQHLHEAAENLLLNLLGLDVNLVFNLGENTPDHHSNSITRLRDIAFDDITNVRWNPAEDFLTPEVTSAQGIWSDGDTMWVLGRPTDPTGLSNDYRGYRLFAYDMRTKERVEEHDLDDLGLAEPRGVWGDDSRIWITDSGSPLSPQDKIFAFDRNSGQRLSEPQIELGTIWLTGIWSQTNSDRIWYVDSGGHRINSVPKTGGGITTYSNQRGKLSGATNLDPQGIWSDGDTMWVADSEKKRIFAYDFPNYWGREIGREFETLDIPGTLANASPTGIWSDGTTMWVADSEEGRIFAYDLEAPPRCVPGREPAPSDRGDGNPFSHNPSRDFGCLPIAEDSISSAIWYDERGWMWVVDRQRAEIHALDATTREQVAGQVFDGLEAAGNEHPRSIWSDGQSMWVLDSTDGHIYAYGMHSKERERDNEFELESSTASGGGIWSNGSVMYVVDRGRAGIHAYPFDTKARNQDADFNGLSNEGNGQPRGIWSDGSTMWVMDSEDKQIYAYDLETKERILERGFLALTDSGISSPFDLASDGTVMWVLDPGGNRIFSYNMPPGLSRTEEPEDTGAFARNRSKEFVGLAEFGLAIPHDIWSDGRTMWVTNGTSTVRAFDLASGARVSARDMDTSGSENAISAGYVWGDEDTLWTWPGFRGINLRTREAVSTRPLPAPAPRTGKGIWSDGETFWVSALGYRDSVPAIWQCLLVTRIFSDRDVPGATEGFILAFDAATGVALPEEDFPSLPAAGNNDPSGIWSDGVTLWVADRDDAKIYAYDLASQERKPDRDFDNLAVSGNIHPAGIWSDGATMWVADSHDGHIYAYNMPPVTGAPPDPDGGAYQPFSRNEWEDFQADPVPTDIWSDGETMWFLAGPSGSQVGAAANLYAFDIRTKNRITERDITISVSDGLRAPQSIWANGTTMWVVDAGRYGKEILAYDIDSRARDQAQDLHNVQFSESEYPGDVSPVGKTLWVAFDGSDRTVFSIDSDSGERDTRGRVGGFADSGNDNRGGIWTDGETLWVSDGEDDKIYAYELASGDRLPGKDFDTLRAAGNNSPDVIWSDGKIMWVTDTEDNRIYAYHMPPKEGASRPVGNLPGRPGYVSSASAGYNEIRLTWSAPDDDGGQPVTSYRIQALPRATQFSGSSFPLPTEEAVWNNLAVAGASSSPSYIHGGLLPQTAMHYRIAAVNSVGQGPWSTVVNSSTDYGGPPGPPQQLAATPGSEIRIDLSWDPPSDTGGLPVRSYTIEESEDGEDWAELADVQSPATSYSHTGLVPESRHYYRVRANGRGWGVWSEVATAVATLASVPGAPKELSASGDSLTDIELAWLPPDSDGGAEITAYQIQISNDGTNWRDLTTISAEDGTTHTDLVLEMGGTRHYRVAAVNVAGAGPWSNVAVGSTSSPQVPGPPLNPEAQPQGISEIELSWEAPATDGGNPITGFEVEVSTDGAQWAALATTTPRVMFYLDTGLQTESTRRYRVAARNAVGLGQWSEVATATAEAEPAPIAPGTPEGDRAALVALYHATNGPNWANNDNWLTNAPLDEWYGVWTGHDGRVSALLLSENLLEGRFPTEIDSLTGLERLDLRRNRLMGSIPAELGNLSNLRDLIISQNQLTGPIPVELGSLSNLQSLQLFVNQLTGPIPVQLERLTELIRLNLGVNRLEGEIPAELGKLRHLESLDLGNNKLSGPIPSELGQLTNLGWLTLFNNELTGSIPDELGNLANLKVLHLGGNRLSGRIPVRLEELDNLIQISLDDNQLTGCVPRNLGEVSDNDVSTLGLPFCGASVGKSSAADKRVLVALYNATNGAGWTHSRNWLTDTPIGEWYGVATNRSGEVIELNLGGNNLRGPILADLGQLASLRKLQLDRNELAGMIPPELGGLSNLEWLVFDTTNLSGAIPPGLGNLSQLTWLSLSKRSEEPGGLTGAIPLELGNLSNLGILYLGGNDLSGTIPEELSKLSKLNQLGLGGNRLNGQIPSWLGGLEDLIGLDLSGNQFTGPVPVELGNLRLDYIRLAGNQLTGCLPDALRLSQRNDLFIMELPFCSSSDDAPTAPVPPKPEGTPSAGSVEGDRAALVALYHATGGPNWTNSDNWLTDAPLNQWYGIQADLGGRVEGLSLSENQLSGEIPSVLQKLDRLQGLVLYGNQLSGKIPHELGNLTSLATLHLESNRLSGVIPDDLGGISRLKGLLLAFNQLSGQIPEDLGYLDDLEYLDLSNNQFSGVIPDDLGRLSRLHTLSLASNQLTGQIPEELGSLESLESLYIGQNQLSGCIPPGLEEIKYNDLESLGLPHCN